MKITLEGRNVEITPRLQSYVERKMERLDRYMNNISDAWVELSHEKATDKNGDGHRAEVTVRSTRGTLLRADERTGDIYAAIDLVVDKMYRQIERYKGRRKRRGAPQEVFDAYEAAADLPLEDEATGTIIRRKEFVLEPMMEEEAIEQMELLGHDFYVFMNADSAEINVMYRRKDGNYGLLMPHLP